MEQNKWNFGDEGTVVSREEMIEALGEGCEPRTYTCFGGPEAQWCAETWQSATTPAKFGVYADSPVPFAVYLGEVESLELAQVAATEVLGRVILTCLAEGKATAALHWRRGTGDEVAVVPTVETADGELHWYAVTCLGGEHWAYDGGGDIDSARRSVAESVLSYGLIDESDEDLTAQDRRDLRSILALEAWAAHVLAGATRDRAEGVHGFLVGAEEVEAILRPE